MCTAEATGELPLELSHILLEMAEVCGALPGDISYTRAILTFYSALPELHYRIQNPNKQFGVIGNPVPGPLAASCATAMKNITMAINYSTMAEKAVLRMCDASLLKADGDLNWKQVSNFIKSNAGADPPVKAKRITVCSAVLRLEAARILGADEIIEEFRSKFPPVAITAGLPHFEYRHMFYDSVRKAITDINTACTSHPRIINFANDTMKRKVGTLRISRLTQTGGGGEGGPNSAGTGIVMAPGPAVIAPGAVVTAGSAASYAPVEAAAEEEEAAPIEETKFTNAAEEAAYRQWKDCTTEYTGPDKLDRDTICILVKEFQLLSREYGKVFRILDAAKTKSEKDKLSTLDSLEKHIRENNPYLATLAAKEVVRKDRSLERYNQYLSFLDIFKTIYKNLFTTAEHIRYKFFKVKPDTNITAIRNFKLSTERARTERKEGGYRRRRRATRKRRAGNRKTKTRRHN